MGRILMAALALLLASSAAQADGGRKALRDRIEASMLVPHDPAHFERVLRERCALPWHPQRG